MCFGICIQIPKHTYVTLTVCAAPRAGQAVFHPEYGLENTPILHSLGHTYATLFPQRHFREVVGVLAVVDAVGPAHVVEALGGVEVRVVHDE